ncbi:MAG: amidohydrolase family protein [Myxococcota bacterium]|jgi:imidazolonepropionase-like amidohydrolase|nr:amidohydrolase family protein [Myxococcota bacterium]
MLTIIENATLLDTETMRLVGERAVTIEGDRIVAVDEAAPKGDGARLIDARGRFLLPGFIDAHVHHVITTMDFRRLATMHAAERAIGMAKLSEGMMQRGFTTVRDTGGDTQGLIGAIERGLCRGARIVPSGRALSQTAGHGDIIPREGLVCACQLHSNDFSHVADGADAVRLAARTELRAGSVFIKIMTSGGVASPTDPFDSLQYTPEEVKAATTETDHRNTYTTSHAYQPDAIRLAIENGVRCIEHGNLIDDAVASEMAELGVTMVPTLVTYKAMAEIGAKVGLPQVNVDKNSGVFEQGRASIEIAKRAGVELGFGTDLLGEAQAWQSQEFRIRAELEPAEDVLRSIYQTNVKLCRLEGEIGRVAPGMVADLVLSPINPLEKLADYDDPQRAIDCVVGRGEVMVDRIG